MDSKSQVSFLEELVIGKQVSIPKARKLDERGSLKKKSLSERGSNGSSKTDPRGFCLRKRESMVDDTVKPSRRLREREKD